MNRFEEKENSLEFYIPKNYDMKPKIFGIFESKSFFLTFVLGILIFKISDIINLSLEFKIQIILITIIPLLLISANSKYEENPIYIFKYILKYFFSKKVYLYKRGSDRNKYGI